VIALGRGVSGIKVGDLVELSRWQGLWFLRPFAEVGGKYTTDSEGWIESTDGTFRQEAKGCDRLVILEPRQIIGLLARRGETEVSDLTIRPLFDRLVFRHYPRPERTASGLHTPLYMRQELPYGQVVAVGPEVGDVAVGDWVVVVPGKGTRWTVDAAPQPDRIGRAVHYTILPETLVEAKWADGDQPDSPVTVFPRSYWKQFEDA